MSRRREGSGVRRESQQTILPVLQMAVAPMMERRSTTTSSVVRRRRKQKGVRFRVLFLLARCQSARRAVESDSAAKEEQMSRVPEREAQEGRCGVE